MTTADQLPYTVETYHSENEWLTARLNGVGASECAAVVNRSRWCSQFGLYVRKLEQRVEEDEDLGHPDAKEMGKRLEPVIEGLFRDFGPKLPQFWHLCAPTSHVIYRSKERPHLFVTPDRVYRFASQPGVVGALELKCAYFDAFKTWKEKVPLAYLLQCQQAMYVLGIKSIWIAVLGNGLQFQWHPVERDQALIDRLLPRLDEFWRRVQEHDPPPVDHSQSTTDALREVYGDGNPEKSIELEWAFSELAERCKAAETVAAKAQAEADTIKNQFRNALGDATTGVLQSGGKVTWRTNSRGARSLRMTLPTRKATTNG